MCVRGVQGNGGRGWLEARGREGERERGREGERESEVAEGRSLCLLFVLFAVCYVREGFGIAKIGG